MNTDDALTVELADWLNQICMDASRLQDLVSTEPLPGTFTKAKALVKLSKVTRLLFEVNELLTTFTSAEEAIAAGQAKAAFDSRILSPLGDC